MTLYSKDLSANKYNDLAFSLGPESPISDHMDRFRDWVKTHQFRSDAAELQAELCLMHIKNLKPDLPPSWRLTALDALHKLERMIGV